ncbi:MAG: DMT family transporter [Candidatus Cryptobacteroides sp.]|nr:DMT family transporter [Bacteroidales bacterium]MBR6362188.1 DMT family transporter [Bacteroidales bacterium]MEE3406536.1 DMT family transporter [Candidatus Cryptobacteroides sp.]
MAYTGEIISLVVAVSWTATALFTDAAGKRVRPIPLNLIRMLMSITLLALTLWVVLGSPYPVYADGKTWFWLAMSGLVGYVFGDFCLFSAYAVIGSRFGQLFMTLAPPVAGIAGMLFLGESLSLMSWLAMLVTVSGIGLSILNRGRNGRLSFKLPFKGILFGIGAGVGQGLGLVLSKVGMNYYTAALPTDAPAAMETIMPFASTFIRAVAGTVGFAALVALRRGFPAVGTGLRDGKAMKLILMATIFGPFVGVSLSLMAVNYTKAGIASTLMALTPVLIIWPYSIIFRQKVTFREVIGAVVSIVGVAMFFL